MANTYLVPIDFSRASERALDFALKMAREKEEKVVALHVVPAELNPPADWQSA
jgi:nucleotide-binding universal stress UspA family protein